jgi:putative transposase
LNAKQDSSQVTVIAEVVRIYPTPDQEVYLKKSCGVSRFAYNWGLKTWQDMYKSGQKVNDSILRKKFNSIKHEEYPWVDEVSKCCPEQAIKNLGKAYANFFKKLKKGDKKGYPKFKKKGKRDSFYLDNDKFKVNGKHLQVPKQKKSIELASGLKNSGRLLSLTISRAGSKWYASFAIEVPKTVHELLEPATDVLGVDLGIKTLATLSNGKTIENQRVLKTKLKKLKRLNRTLARRKKGSKRREKAKLAVANLHRKVRFQRKDMLHQATNVLVRSAQVIVIEDLAVKNMSKNHRLALHISDVGFGMFRQMLKGKCEKYGRQLIVVNRYYPSSKTCSRCGNIKENLTLKDRVFYCESCGFQIDRDLNAAVNLEKQGRILLVRTETKISNARGDCVNPLQRGSDRGSENELTGNNSDISVLPLI